MTNLRTLIDTNLRLAREAKTADAAKPFWEKAGDQLVIAWGSGNLYTKEQVEAMVGVKPLEWEHHDGNYPKWTVYVAVWGGMFEAKIDKGEAQVFGRFPLFINGQWDKKKHQNLRSAKAAAQSAYDKCSTLQPAPVTVQQAAVDALASYQQADMDGIMVTVSRQAIEECLPALRALSAKEGE